MVQLRVSTPPPERQRRLQMVTTGHGIVDGRRGGEMVRKRRHVDARAVRVQPVAVRSGGDPDAGGQQAAQPGDVRLDRPGRVGRDLVRPHHVHQACNLDGPPQMRREGGEQPPLTDGSDPHRTAVAFHQQRPEDAERYHDRHRPRPDTADGTAEPPLTCALLVT